jgi:hypothetical protein
MSGPTSAFTTVAITTAAVMVLLLLWSATGRGVFGATAGLVVLVSAFLFGYQYGRFRE